VPVARWHGREDQPALVLPAWQASCNPHADGASDGSASFAGVWGSLTRGPCAGQVLGARRRRACGDRPRCFRVSSNCRSPPFWGCGNRRGWTICKCAAIGERTEP